jgi:hypothetical protein
LVIEMLFITDTHRNLTLAIATEYRGVQDKGPARGSVYKGWSYNRSKVGPTDRQSTSNHIRELLYPSLDIYRHD